MNPLKADGEVFIPWGTPSEDLHEWYESMLYDSYECMNFNNDNSISDSILLSFI
jgi:hypothetical protein